MNRIENLRDLFIQQGRELYNSTVQQMEELPRIEQQAVSTELKRIITRQINKVQNQQVRLAEALRKINASPDGERCIATESILKQIHSNINRCPDDSVRDAGIINQLQTLIHRKLAGYGTTTSYAREIGQEYSARTLHEALVEERELDVELSSLAEEQITRTANMAIVA